ncbi:iron-siderophore ABC transporter substrate-binding protein [Streptomonospora wellingtoniae]|uniref:Iron-siderophore ABC transporter substrate-binding protein n=1 Tax=Streptomonospora wellingtoniae TaxID=3075544 RepID=A0ABU2KWT6_9ACTN|nr:iron-siderophore ABC transporter substrate-binding protein [Streptomonospora sp. DSM 45055]MDT0303766.1 iron-siderophore ABC transporter substrate-binding protein [Streptomonospora sp. DSM 45055]
MPSLTRAPAPLARIALVAAAALAAAGCGAPSGSDNDSGGSGGDWSPVTIEHAHGSTTIEQKPERIVTVGWSDEATLLELGIVPVGMNASTYAGDEEGYLPWDLAKIEEMGAEKPELVNTDDGISAEQVANLAPDLVLGVQSGMTQKEYKQLSEVAPTIPYLEEPWMTGWQEQTVTIGKAVGKEEEAREIADETASYIDGLSEKHPEFEGTSYAVGTLIPSTGEFGFYVEKDARVVIMNQLGLQPAGFTDDLSVADGQFYGTLSQENSDKVDADVLVMWFNSDQERKKMEDNPVFQKIDAVQDDAYVGYVDPAKSMAISTPNPLTIPWVMDGFVEDLGKAAEGGADASA